MEEDKSKKYKRIQCKKKKPFKKWLFSKRDLESRVLSLFLFAVFSAIGLMFYSFDNSFSHLGFGLSIVIPILLGSSFFLLLELLGDASDIAKSNKSKGRKGKFKKENSTIYNFIKGMKNIKRDSLIEALTVSTMFFSIYILCMLVFFTLSIISSIYVGIGGFGLVLLSISIYINYELEIDKDIMKYKMKKDTLREMRMKEILDEK